MLAEQIIEIPNSDTGFKWQKRTGKFVNLCYDKRTVLANQADVELRKAEIIASNLYKLLKLSSKTTVESTTLYLTNQSVVTTRPPVTIATSLQPQETVEGEIAAQTSNDSAEKLIFMLVPQLLINYFKNPLPTTDPFLAGISGWLAADFKKDYSVNQIRQQLQKRLLAGEFLSIFQKLSASPETEQIVLNSESSVITSLVTFLINRYGEKPVTAFLADYNGNNLEQAIQLHFQRSAGSLEELWLTWLRQTKSKNGQLIYFVGQLLKLTKPYRLRQLEVIFYMLLGMGYILVLPLSTRHLIDVIIPAGNLGFLVVFLIGLFFVYITHASVQLRRVYVNNYINFSVSADILHKLFRQVQYLSHEFYNRSKVGELLARFTRDIETLENAMGQFVGVGVYLILNLFIASVAMLSLHFWLGATILMVVPAVAACYLALRKQMVKSSTLEAELYSDIVAHLEENLAAHTVVKAFGLELFAISHFQKKLQALFKTSLRGAVITGGFELTIAFATTLSQLIILGVGGYLVIDKQITIGTLLAFIGLLPALFTPISILSNMVQTTQRGTIALERVNQLLEESVSVTEKPEAKILPPLTREIRLQNVTFGYDSSRQILNIADLRFPVGKHTAIVGPSGAGKSTLAQLLIRFWDPNSGTVRFDDYDLRDVTLSSLRNQIGLIAQDTFVFNLTARENIALAKLQATDTEIRAAARAARLDGYLQSLAAGYETVLGERGVKMSGGERQRLAIARVLLRKPQLLILDEATSALDVQTESEVVESLKMLAGNCTIVSVTHRLNLAASADHIVVLNQGSVEEQGTHQELLGNKGLYWELHQEQTAQYLAV